MAENQSAASEDSGHQQQQQQQHQHQQQQQPPLASTTTNTTSSSLNAASTAASSLVNQSPTNSQASSPENSQEALPLVRRQQSAATAAVTTVAVAATSSNTPQQQQRSSLSNMFDRTVNAKFKTSAANAGPGPNPGRRNSMLTPAKGASVGGTGGNLRKLTKVNSLTRDYGLCYSPIPTIYQNSNNAGSNAATLQRTTSESLRLNSLNRVASVTAATSVSRAISNSSLATVSSTSTSLAPKSSSSSCSASDATPQQQQQQPSSGNTSSSSSSSNSGGKASSPNNNGARAVGGAAAATAGTGTASHHHQPHHHHHHHHHHQHHHHQQQQHPHQTSLSQGHASLTVAGMTGGASGSGSSGVAGAGSSTRKPKTTSSFEITSVTVGHPKLNAAGDTGDESADDLDESHTDDNSRITDLENETPSMSEDTFSKEEVYYANNALSPNAPVIPTSSQYGLVVVDPIGPSLGQTIQNVQVNVSDIINSVSAAVTPGGTKKKDDTKETQHRSERFKVVKIESTEPFKRGRWMCMDYLDHSSVGNGGNNNEKTGSSSEATTDGVGGSDATPQKTTQSMILPPTQKLNENHLEANSTDANWNYAEQQSQQQQSSQQQHQQHSHQQQQSSQQQQQTQMSATPSGVMTAPATVVHGMHQLHMEAQQQQQQQQQLFDSVNANASSPNPQSVDTGNMGYALTAAMQLQQTLQQLKQREEAMESGYQNGGDVAGGAPNNNNSGGGGGPAAATAESQLSTSYVEQQQQPLSPAPQTPQITPTFAAVAAGQAAPNFQLEQQQQQPQATSQIDGILPQSFPQQQQQQQQTPQQSTPQQQAPPVAAAATAGATAVPATQQQTSNTSNAAVTTGQGQTLPLISHMTSYEQQPSSAGAGASAAGSGTAATSVAVPSPAIPTLHLQSAPATIADPQQLMVPQQQQEEQQQQQQQQQPQIPPTNIASASANNSNLNLTNPNVEPTTNALTLTEEQVIAATSATGAAAKAAPGATSTSAATQLQQLQQQPNAESETESFNTSAFPGGNRKRAFSNPHIGLVGGGAGGATVDPGAFMHRLNPQLYYYNKSHSGRSSFCVDESLWPTNPNHNARASDTNLYMGSSTDEDYEEAIDQFSPTLYTRSGASRAIPIPTSAGNSPQRQLHPQLNPHQARIATGINSAAAAFSASPSIYAYPHSPFYASSPETSTLSSPVQMSGMAGHAVHSSRISFSYDPAFQRLQVPKPRSPLECASVFAAVAAAATCGGGGDPHQMGMATPVNSASGTSAVAIDNKIEQAMDLVKSHLMIAVREEVEVLKERISELMDKINKLELENNILKSNIPQETLQQLQMQLQIAGSQQPAAVAAPPATPAIQAPPTSATTAAGQAAAAAAASVGAVTAAVVVGSTGAGATSPASAVAPTSIPNGSAENGSISAVSGSSGNNSDASIVDQVTAGAAAVPTVNGPMS